MLLQSDAGLGSVEHQIVIEEIESSSTERGKRSVYKKFIRAHYEIDKYAAQNENSDVIRHFKSKGISESTVRTLKSKYCVELKAAVKEKRSPKKALDFKNQGASARGRVAIINTNIAIVKYIKNESLKHLSLGRPWAQSLFRPTGYVGGLQPLEKSRFQREWRENMSFYLFMML